ncbi:DUF1735 and LamG domain-containing protein [Flavobacteriaceae bacterium]|nr:DUF1735 and LamG domain-containing protein [Flavobacteriaceae bacterium]
MKNRVFKYLQFATYVFLVSTLVSCNGDQFETIENGVYFKESLKTDFQKVAIENEATAEVTLSIANIVDKDTKYKLTLSPSNLKEYNERNGSSFQSLPSTQVELPSEILIKAGESQSEKIQIKIKGYTEEMIASGSSYAIPLQIESMNSEVLPVGKTSTYIVGLERIFETKAVLVRAANWSNVIESGEVFRFNISEKDLKFPSLTMEFWMAISKVGGGAKFHGHPRNRLFIFKNNGDGTDQWHVWNDGDHPNSRNFSLTSRNTDLVANAKIVPNEWAHYALVYDGASGTVKIYVNGVEEGSASIGSVPYNFSNKAWGFNRSFGDNNFAIREFRFWSVARTGDQVKNNMETINPTTPGLELYTKFDQDENGLFIDLSGHEGRSMEYCNYKYEEGEHTFTKFETPKPIEYIDYKVGEKKANLE